MDYLKPLYVPRLEVYLTGRDGMCVHTHICFLDRLDFLR